MTARIGILSAAHLHSESYAEHLAATDEAELVGVADTDTERGRSLSNRYNTAYCSPEDLLRRADGVVICSENADHVDWIEAAADAGVHALCEKPLATDAESAASIVETCADAGIELGVAMPLRFSDATRDARSRLAADDIGDIRAISGTNRGQFPGEWFGDPDRAGGGAVMDHTVHIVDLVYHLTGREVVEVYAELGTRFHDIPVEDVNVLSMELDDGTQFLLDGSWSRPENWHTWGDATVEFVGTDGVLSVDCFAQSIWHTADAGEQTGISSEFWGTDPNQGLIDDFVTAVAEGRCPEISGRDGVMAVAVVDAAYRSAERGEPVRVEH
jgi:predicted dehydrogenase